jgi:hypothetical protein
MADPSQGQRNETGQAEPPARDSRGLFLPGNKVAVGHGGSAQAMAKWRKLAFSATTEEDMLAVWGTLIACAKAGEAWAVHEFLDRTHGKVVPPPPEAAENHAEMLYRYWQAWGAPSGPRVPQVIERDPAGGSGSD